MRPRCVLFIGRLVGVGKMNNKRIVLNRRTHAEVVITELQAIAGEITKKAGAVESVVKQLRALGRDDLAEKMAAEITGYGQAMIVIDRRLSMIQAMQKVNFCQQLNLTGADV